MFFIRASTVITNAISVKLLSCSKLRPTAILILSICNSAKRKWLALAGKIDYPPSVLLLSRTRKF